MKNTLRVTLARRKNRPEPTQIVRRCDCARNAALCPHAVAERRVRWVKGVPRSRLFTVTYATAHKAPQAACAAVGQSRPEEYTFHAFRRGFAQDLLRANTPLRDILAACDWRSATFAWYLSRESIDAQAVLQAAAELSGEEDS